MNLIEAVRSANAEGKGIIRESSPFSKSIAIPTNTRACCIILADSAPGQRETYRNWNPTLDDILAEDWTVSD